MARKRAVAPHLQPNGPNRIQQLPGDMPASQNRLARPRLGKAFTFSSSVKRSNGWIGAAGNEDHPVRRSKSRARCSATAEVSDDLSDEAFPDGVKTGAIDWLEPTGT
jgi:hypothetical protein